MSEERDPDLNEEEGIRMENNREENWRDVFECCGDKSNMHTLVWYVYTRDKY